MAFGTHTSFPSSAQETLSLTCLFCMNTSRVPAVLMQGNLTKPYISYQSLLPRSLSHASSADMYNRIPQKNYSQTQHFH